jgi:hypothetical protein
VNASLRLGGINYSRNVSHLAVLFRDGYATQAQPGLHIKPGLTGLLIAVGNESIRVTEVATLHGDP